MKGIVKYVVAVAAVLLVAGAADAAKPASPGNGNGNGKGPKTCDPAVVDAAAAAITAACACDGTVDASGEVVAWRNHGQYVRCVAHATRDAVKDSDGALTRRCLASAVKCAARSTCGRAAGFVNCTRSTTSACIAGACDDGSACTTDDDCTESSCSFRRTADACVAIGGVPGTGSCCAPVPVGSPSGAFVDGAAFY